MKKFPLLNIEGTQLFDEAEGIESVEDEHEAQDDGVTIDEDGTEWYEDETGVWWYREAGMDDWEEYANNEK